MQQLEGASFNIDLWMKPQHHSEPKNLSQSLANHFEDAVIFHSEKMVREVHAYGYEMKAWLLALEADPNVASYNEAPPECSMTIDDIKVVLNPHIVILGRDSSITAIRLAKRAADFSKAAYSHAKRRGMSLVYVPPIDREHKALYIENTFRMLRFIETHAPRLRPAEVGEILRLVDAHHGPKTLGAVCLQMAKISPSRAAAAIAHLIFEGQLIADLDSVPFDRSLVIKCADASLQRSSLRLDYFNKKAA